MIVMKKVLLASIALSIVFGAILAVNSTAHADDDDWVCEHKSWAC